MKNRGLQNRFPEKEKLVWLYHYSCLICRMNSWDALHHIVSPSSRHFIQGKHNVSILNSCPIHNQKCHIGQESYLHKTETIKMLLKSTLEWLLDFHGYQLKEIDKEFMLKYKHLYE